MHKYPANKYFLSVYTSETLCIDGRVSDEIREKVPDCGAGDWKSKAAVSVETVARYCK